MPTSPSSSVEGGGELRAGSAFVNAATGQVPSHLWVVISDPERDLDNVLIANLTSYDGVKDGTCLLKAGDHPFVRHDTVVNYADARCTSVARIAEGLRTGLFMLKADLDPEILRRVRDGFHRSRHAKRAYRQLLIDQGFGPPPGAAPARPMF